MAERRAKPSAHDELISSAELARKLGVSRRTVDTLKAKKVISPFYVGGQIRYDYSKVVRELEVAPKPKAKNPATAENSNGVTTTEA